MADDAARFAGQQVDGPLTAYYEADVIATHSMALSGGKTYAELDREDPARALVMNGSFLRASLFTRWSASASPRWPWASVSSSCSSASRCGPGAALQPSEPGDGL